jgi:YidC/Oxa1 family membrane protein insertase
VNKNTLFAFVLILGTVALFSSPTWNRFYYNKILQQPFPADIVKNQKPLENSGSEKSAAPVAPDALKQPTTVVVSPPSAAKPTDSSAKKGDTVWIETKKIIAGISEVGARIVTLKMKEYRLDHLKGTLETKDSSGYVDLIPANSLGGAGLTINNKPYDAMLFSLQDTGSAKKIAIGKGERKAVTFMYRDGQGNVVEKRFLFNGDSYEIGLKIASKRLANSRLTVAWPGGITESERNKGSFYKGETRAVHYSDGTDVWHVQESKPNNQNFEQPPSGSYRWIGISSKYFFSAIVTDEIKDADLKINAFDDSKKEIINGKENITKGVNYGFSFQYTPQEDSSNFWFYTGPAKADLLKAANLHFQAILFPVLSFWKHFLWADKWFPPVAEFILWLLLIFFHFMKDYGVSIILLTILSRVVTYPLTQSSMKSMTRMKDVQPKINAIRQKYKSSPQKMNAEIMALYKSEGINPLNPGCLPMFLQMPVFIALFVVLQKAIELRGAGTVLVPWIHDLSRPESVFSLTSILPNGIPMYGSNFAILPVVMAILTFFQNKATIKDPNQKMMIYFMPIFMLVLFNNFPSGLVLYWTVSSALGLLQQYYNDHKKRKIVVEEKRAPVPVSRGKGKKGR